MRFLWSGGSNKTGKAKVAWDSITLQKEEGGLGIKDICEWNTALILKTIFSILNPHSTSLWADWVRKTLVKRTSIWTLKYPSKCSWILKQVLKLRPIAANHISYLIGNGEKTSLWFDPWSNGAPICLTPLDPIISHSGLDIDAKVSSILNSAGWDLPTSNFLDVTVWRQNFTFPAFNLNKADIVKWDGISAKELRVTDFWESIRHRGPNVAWANSVWHKLVILFSTG